MPALVEGGFVVGAEYGRGVATCRTNGSWSAPSFFRSAAPDYRNLLEGRVTALANVRELSTALSSSATEP